MQPLLGFSPFFQDCLLSAHAAFVSSFFVPDTHFVILFGISFYGNEKIQNATKEQKSV